MDAAISSGDFVQVSQLKAKRQLTDHEKVTILSTHFVPPRNNVSPLVGFNNLSKRQVLLEKWIESTRHLKRTG